MGRISTPQGKGNLMHNRRDYEKYGKEIPENIDRSRTKFNVVLVDRDLKEVYQEVFGEALEKYNAKQKRADRKIDSYYDHILKSKNGEKLMYEDVIQWGRKEDFENNPRAWDLAKRALIRYVEEWELRNPNLKLVGAYIHMDEASPHLHLDYIPIARGYTRGLEVRNSLNKALEQQGIELKARTKTVKNKETGLEEEVELAEGRFNNLTMAWKEAERAEFARLCVLNGLEVEEERSWGRKQLTVAEFKEAEAQMLEPIIEKRDIAQTELEQIQARAETLEEQYTEQAKKANALASAVLKKQHEEKQLDFNIAEKKEELATTSEAVDQQAQQLKSGKSELKKVEALTKPFSEDTPTIHKVNLREKKTLMGKTLCPPMKGTYIPDVTPEAVEAVFQRSKTIESLDSAYDRVKSDLNNIQTQAITEAEQIRGQAQKEAQQIKEKAKAEVQEAQSIIAEKDNILSAARRAADKFIENAKAEIAKLTAQLHSLRKEHAEQLAKKDSLEKELAEIEASRASVEPLRQEVADLKQATATLKGELDNEFTKSRFTDRIKNSLTALEQGKVVALYKDGHTETVTKSEDGGFDYKHYFDEQKGLCTIGTFEDEPRVKVPRSILNELMASLDPQKEQSLNLQNFIKQQTHVQKITKTYGLKR